MEAETNVKSLRMRCLRGVQVGEAFLLATLARNYRADITIRHEDLRANARNLMEILWLGARSNSVIELTVTGEETERALAGLESLFDNPEPPVFARVDYSAAADAATCRWAGEC